MLGKILMSTGLVLLAACSTSAPQPGSASADAMPPSAALRYMNQASDRILAQMHIPTNAYERREQGTLVVHLAIAEDGAVDQARVIKSSGSPSLDQEALIAVHRVGRFAPLPAGLGGGPGELSFDLPIEFRIVSPTGMSYEP